MLGVIPHVYHRRAVRSPSWSPSCSSFRARANLLVGNDIGMALQDGELGARGGFILGGDVGVAVVALDSDATAVLDRVRMLGAGTAVEELACCGFTATAERR
jgi:hypothetical protein